MALFFFGIKRMVEMVDTMGEIARRLVRFINTSADEGISRFCLFSQPFDRIIADDSD